VNADDERLQAAASLLQEAVHRAREPHAGAEDEPALGPHGQELLHTLWPQPICPTRLARLGSVLAEWVERSDALARERNRFVRDFRTAHGFDRRAYTPAETRELDSGLARLDSAAGEHLRRAAQDLLTLP